MKGIRALPPAGRRHGVQLALASALTVMFFGFPSGGQMDYLKALLLNAGDASILTGDLGLDEYTRFAFLPLMRIVLLLSEPLGAEAAINILAVLSLSLLFHALCRFAKSLSMHDISPLVPCALYLCGGTHVLLGNHIFHNVSLYPQFIASSLIFLGLAALLKNRTAAAVSYSALCIIVHPVTGGVLASVTIIHSFFHGASNRFAAWGLRLLLLAFICLYYYFFIKSENFDAQALNQARHIFMYIRSPGHFFVEHWQRPIDIEQVCNFVLMLGFCLGYIVLEVDDRQKKILLGSGTLMIGIVCGLLLAFPGLFGIHFFFITYPFRFSIILLGLTYAFGACLLYRLVPQGSPGTSMCLLTAFTACTFGSPLFFGFLLLMLMIPRVLRVFPAPGVDSRTDTGAGPATVAAMLALVVVIPPKNMGEAFLMAALTFIAHTILRLGFGRSGAAWLAGCALFTQVALFVPGAIKTSGPAGAAASAAWIEVCEYIRKNTPGRSIVVIPLNRGHSDFQARTARAAYVSLKFIPRSPSLAIKWADRLKRLRCLPKDLDYSLLNDVTPVSTKGYESLTVEDFIAIAHETPGVDFCVTLNRLQGVEPVFVRDQYAVYSIREVVNRL